MSPHNQVVTVGNDATLVCSVANGTGASWRFYNLTEGTQGCLVYDAGGTSIPDCPDNNVKYTVSAEGDFYNLTVHSIDTTDAGTYVCTELATNAGHSALLGVISKHSRDCLWNLFGWRGTQLDPSVCQ